MIELCTWPRVGSANSFEFLKVSQLRTTERAHEWCREKKFELSSCEKYICSDAQAGNRDYVSVNPEHMCNSSPVKYVPGTNGTRQHNISASACDNRQKCCAVESFAPIQEQSQKKICWEMIVDRYRLGFLGLN